MVYAAENAGPVTVAVLAIAALPGLLPDRLSACGPPIRRGGNVVGRALCRGRRQHLCVAPGSSAGDAGVGSPEAPVSRFQRRQLLLSAVFVFGCVPLAPSPGRRAAPWLDRHSVVERAGRPLSRHGGGIVLYGPAGPPPAFCREGRPGRAESLSRGSSFRSSPWPRYVLGPRS